MWYTSFIATLKFKAILVYKLSSMTQKNPRMGMGTCPAWEWRKPVTEGSCGWHCGFGREAAGKEWKDLYTGETKVEFPFPPLSFFHHRLCI